MISTTDCSNITIARYTDYDCIYANGDTEDLSDFLSEAVGMTMDVCASNTLDEFAAANAVKISCTDTISFSQVTAVAK